jgi:hypothetical protein
MAPQPQMGCMLFLSSFNLFFKKIFKEKIFKKKKIKIKGQLGLQHKNCEIKIRYIALTIW